MEAIIEATISHMWAGWLAETTSKQQAPQPGPRAGSGFSPLDREDIEPRAEVVSLLAVPRIVRRVNAVELAP